MLSKTRSMPVYSPAAGVILDGFGGTARNAPAVNPIADPRATSGSTHDPTSRTFLAFEDNVDGHRWMIVDEGGELLVRFASFRSDEEADPRSPRGASQSWFAHRSPIQGQADLPAVRDAVMARERLDAERWSDDGGASAASGCQ